MDENANANAQGTPPNPPAQPSEGANGTDPSSAAAENAKATSDKADPQAGGGTGKPTFEPEVQKFLDNQNIKTDNLQEAVAELARRNMKLRATQPEKTESQSVADVLNQKPEPKATVAEQVMKSAADSVNQNPQPQQQPSHRLSDMDIANVSMFVKQQYPDVTTDAEFYKAMMADGFKPVTSDGEINLRSVLSYAKYQQKLHDADKAIKAAEPQANQVPTPSTAPEYAKVDKVQTMTEQAAQNIIMFSNTERRYGRPIHPQYDEAVEFIQNLARGKK